jgi:copper transport protein
VVLPHGDSNELRRVLPRYSALALGAVVALVVTGGFQSWRQVGSLDALRETDFGRLLIAKVVAFAVLIVAAAFSREVVNRRFRAADDDVSEDEETDEHDDEETEVRRLRRSVAVEVFVAAVVLSLTALLVNAAPARTVSTAPVGLTLKSAKLWVSVTIAPGVAGGNDVHVTTVPTGGGFTDVQGMEMQLVKVGADLPPFTVPLRKLTVGHFYAPLYEIPYPGEWQMVVRVQVSATDEVVLTGRFSLR